MSQQHSQSYTNRLAAEKSPYLLQHAHNPVDWYAWSEDAFEAARSQNKPVFLSIGYSTCHWCHVMEEESFENPEIAKVMNKHFINIKVDREERPDVDAVYMQAVMAMTGSGGWPMSVFLTPDLKPFYGGTYFPPHNAMGRPGFMTVLSSLAQKWQTEKDRIEKAGESLTAQLRQHMEEKARGTAALSDELQHRAYEDFQARYDSRHGGFGEAPKFPSAHNLSFMLAYESTYKRSHEMVETTLKAMARGGMYDQLEGGFHRYSTDSRWHVPHFEKMLYDQANLTRVYAQAWQITGDAFYKGISKGIMDYVLSRMTHKEGAFFSAEDADSLPVGETRKKEGACYVWSFDEFTRVLGEDRARLVAAYYGVMEQGNAEHDPMGEFTGKNILYAAGTLEEIAASSGLDTDKAREIIEKAARQLLSERNKRPAPHLDDKVLTDWNGFMIAGMAYAGRVFREKKYVLAAKKAADFILNTMMDPNGALKHRWREGEAAISGFLDDYAYLAFGLLELYQALQETTYLEKAVLVLERMKEEFWDTENGGFYFAPVHSKKLITRNKELYDGAMPSGNSIATTALIMAARILKNGEFEKTARENLEYFSALIARFPSGFSQMMLAFGYFAGASSEVVLAEGEDGQNFRTLLDEVSRAWLPFGVLAFNPGNPAEREKMKKLSSFVAAQGPVNGKSAVYVCKDHQCRLPVTDAASLREVFGKC